MKRLTLAAAVLAATLAPGFARAIEGDRVDLLPGGYVCDRKDQVCYDSRGANVFKTREMFGDYAARDVQKRLNKRDEWGTRRFTLSNGVKCNVPNRACKKEEGEGERARKITRHLFGGQNPQPR